MRLVVDSNVLFSTLIKQAITAKVLVDFSLNLYAPEFMLEEFEKHKPEVLLKTKRTKEEFNEVFFALALKLNCPIWSNDKELKEQDKVKVYSTEEMLKINA